MSYLASGKIKVFPTSKRDASYNNYSRLTTEKNLINITNKITDQKSFVISYKYDSTTSKYYIDFCIHGYYFYDVEINDILPASGNTLYAHIGTKETNGLEELIGDDTTESGSYNGVVFDFTANTSITDATTSYHLPLLNNDNGTTNVVFDSYIKLQTNQNFRSITIDDGDLDT